MRPATSLIGASKGKKAGILGRSLDEATEKFLEENRSPSRKVNELDTRGSHFYLALYWARALAKQEEEPALAGAFQKVASDLEAQTDTILQELLDAQGQPQDIGGYYLPDAEKVRRAMRPSRSFNAILEQL